MSDNVNQDDDFEPNDVEIPDEDFDEDLPESEEPNDTPKDDENPATEDDELGFSFDEPETADGKDPYAGKPAPEWVKAVRDENRELKRQLKQQQAQQPQQFALRDKPTLAMYDYDEAAYEADLQHWYGEKTRHDEVVQSEQTRYQQIDDNYRSSVDNVRRLANDYDEVEQHVVDMLPPEQQALIKMGVADPAKLVYALGKSPNKLAALSKLDSVQFVKQIALMEYQMTNKTRNPNKAQPKTHNLTGEAGGGDSQLAKLEAEAAKTGDRSAISAYKRKLRNK